VSCGDDSTKFSGNQAGTTALFFQIPPSEEFSVEQRGDLGELLWGAAPLNITQATCCFSPLRTLSHLDTAAGSWLSPSRLFIALVWKAGLQGA